MSLRSGMTLGALAVAASGLAGDLSLNANADTGFLIPQGTPNYQTATGAFGGVGSFGPVSASSTVTNSNESIYAFENVSANITGETSGSVTYNEGWQTSLTSGTSQGFANMAASAPGSVLQSTYTFSTTGATNLLVSFASTYTSDVSSDPAFGLYNMVLVVDGTVYAPDQFQLIKNSGHWVPPQATGSWTVGLASAGSHTIGFYSTSNISAGLAVENSTLTETLNFSTSAVPEPVTVFALGLGALGLVARRRRADLR